jgi:hypothetical protein
MTVFVVFVKDYEDAYIDGVFSVYDAAHARVETLKAAATKKRAGTEFTLLEFEVKD